MPLSVVPGGPFVFPNEVMRSRRVGEYREIRIAGVPVELRTSATVATVGDGKIYAEAWIGEPYLCEDNSPGEGLHRGHPKVAPEDGRRAR